ncbi:MAG: hypothetical protein QOD75_706 [Blastocatellia bacterium]|jgi:anti-sigma factor RsiW|nr:hypothetical protein [Blastocatellia bacterium]
MNCKQVQELLPLFAGHDLDDRSATRVAAHVQSCALCERSASEYFESRQLLQQFAPPSFSEGVYSGMRQRVLREISEESLAPALPQRIVSLFRPNLSWAVATAVLLAVSGLAFYLIATRENGPQQVSQRSEQPNTSPSPKNLQAATATNSGNGGWVTTIQNNAVPTRGTAQMNRPAQPPRRTNSTGPLVADVAANTPERPSMAGSTALPVNNLTESNVVPATDATGSERTLRVDMQTSDQNIRIIWFTRQPAKQGTPGKSSKHDQEASSRA